MIRTLAQKMGLKEGVRSFIVNAPFEVLRAIKAPELDLPPELDGEFEYLHLFANSQQQLERELYNLKPHLHPRGALWVSWPKGGQLETDLSLREVIRIGYKCGLVESTTLSIDSIWSAMKFTHPKPGKTYNNSYGKLVRN